jgi:hypothetical protein
MIISSLLKSRRSAASISSAQPSVHVPSAEQSGGGGGATKPAIHAS